MQKRTKYVVMDMIRSVLVSTHNKPTVALEKADRLNTGGGKLQFCVVPIHEAIKQ